MGIVVILVLTVNETPKGGISYSLECHICPQSVPYFNLQWKIHKVVAHWVRPSLVHSLFPVTACINFCTQYKIKIV